MCPRKGELPSWSKQSMILKDLRLVLTPSKIFCSSQAGQLQTDKTFFFFRNTNMLYLHFLLIVFLFRLICNSLKCNTNSPYFNNRLFYGSHSYMWKYTEISACLINADCWLCAHYSLKLLWYHKTCKQEQMGKTFFSTLV